MVAKSTLSLSLLIGIVATRVKKIELLDNYSITLFSAAKWTVELRGGDFFA